MSDEYEIIWDSGHIERLRASQVSWPNASRISGIFSAPEPDAPDLVNFHDMIDERWTLVLQARADHILSIRNITRAPGSVLEDEK